jgi:ABC-type branched-subunit amino acid transport system substrate-binding protein
LKEAVTPHRLLAPLLASFIIWISACQAIQPPPEEPPTAEAIPTPSPQIIEVTRVIETQVIVPATREPPDACVPEDAGLVEEIVIGALLPLSPPGAVTAGFAMQAALSVAVEHVNASGGILGTPARLVTYDTAGTPSRATVLAERLITQDCAIALVGAFDSDVAAAVRDVATRFMIPAILIRSPDDDLMAGNPPTSFRIGPTESMLAQMDSAWLAQVGDFNEDGEMVAVHVRDSSADSAATAEESAEWFERHGINRIEYVVDLPARDFSPVIARIVDLEMIPDAVFVRLPPAPSSLDFHRQMMDAGIGPMNGTLIVTTDAALDDEQFWTSVPDGKLSVVTQIGPWLNTVSDLGVRFANDYAEYFARWPELHAFETYDAFRLVAEAAERAGTLRSADIVKVLEEDEFELAAGRYYFPVGSRNPLGSHGDDATAWHQWPDPPLLFMQYTDSNQPSAEAAVVWPDEYRTVDSPIVRHPAP